MANRNVQMGDGGGNTTSSSSTIYMGEGTFVQNSVKLSFKFKDVSWVDNGDGTSSCTPIVQVKRTNDTLQQAVYFKDIIPSNAQLLIVTQTRTDTKCTHFSSGSLSKDKWVDFAKLPTITYNNSDADSNKSQAFHITFKNILYNGINYQTASNDILVTASFTHKKSAWTHTFVASEDYETDGDLVYENVQSSFSAPGLTRDGDESSKSYNIDWINTATNEVAEASTSTEENTKWWYTNVKWDSPNVQPISGGSTVSGDKLKADRTWTATSKENSKTTDAKVGSLASNCETDGYTFKGWYDSKDFKTKVSTTKVLTSDATFYAYMQPNQYYVKFNLGENADAKQTPPKQLTKTYRKNLPLTENGEEGSNFTYNKYLRNGYVQTGWKEESRDDEEKFTKYLTEDYSYGAERPANGDPVTLVPTWENTLNHIDFVYYVKTGTSSYAVRHDIQDFVIEDYVGTEPKTEPENPYSTEPNNSYTFLGWCLEKPAHWDEYHGVYNNIYDIDKNVYFPYSYKFDPSEQWIADKTITRYGVWTSTGKYVCLGGEDWRKINLAYIYTEDGWRPVVNFYANTGSGWKHEVDNVYGE